MRALQALLMLLGALAALMTGALPASARADATSMPPCHESATRHGGADAPQPTPGKTMKAMDCCIACVAAPNLPPPDRSRVMAPAPATQAAPVAVPAGERPAPEPHPPRPFLD